MYVRVEAVRRDQPIACIEQRCRLDGKYLITPGDMDDDDRMSFDAMAAGVCDAHLAETVRKMVRKPFWLREEYKRLCDEDPDPEFMEALEEDLNSPEMLAALEFEAAEDKKSSTDVDQEQADWEEGQDDA